MSTATNAIDMSPMIFGSLAKMMREYGRELLGKVHEKYPETDLEEMMAEFGLAELSVSKKPAKTVAKKTNPEKKAAEADAKPTMSIPFVGRILEHKCHAVKVNDGLFTQCFNEKHEGSDYCKICGKAGAKYGDIRERLEQGADWTDKSKARAPKHYSSIFRKLQKENITKEMVNEQVFKFFGVELDDSEFEVPEKKKLVVVKKTVAVKTRENGAGCGSGNSEDSSESMHTSTAEESDEELQELPEQDEEETIDLKGFKRDGKQFYRDNKNNVYDAEQELIEGKMWSEKSKSIVRRV